MQRILKWILILLAVALAGFLLFAPGIVERNMNKVLPVAAKAGPRALALHKTLAIADMHSDTLMWKRDVLDLASRGHVDLPRLEDGHVALQVFSSVSKTPKGQNYDANGSDSDNITLLTIAQLQPPRTWSSILERSLYHASKLQRAADNSGGRLRFIQTSADLAKLLADRAHGQQVTGAVFSVEGLQNLEGKLANLDRLQAAGMRMAGLTHFFDNEVAHLRQCDSRVHDARNDLRDVIERGCGEDESALPFAGVSRVSDSGETCLRGVEEWHLVDWDAHI